jgi:Alginate export
MVSSSLEGRATQLAQAILLVVVSACLTITGIAQTPPSASAPPAYQSLRYDEDWAYLSDRTQRSDALDSLKFIPLNDRAWFLSLGGEARIRYEYFSQFNFGAGPQTDKGYMLQRYLFHTDTHLGKRLRFFVQLQSGIENGRNGGPRPTDQDRLDLHQAFIDWKIGTETKSLTVRLGRHEMEFGSGRFISAGEGLNVRRSFDGVRLIYRQKNWLINASADKLVSINPGIFDDTADPTVTYWGAGATRTNSKIGGGHQFAYLALDRKFGRFDRGVGREIRHSIVARTYGVAKQIDYNFDSIVQWGSFRSAGRQADIRAWAAASDTGYTIKQFPLKPRLGLRADATSGDRNPYVFVL